MSLKRSYSSQFGSLQVTPRELLPIAQPIQAIVTWFCAFGILLILISTLRHFLGKNRILKSIKYTVSAFYITSFLCVFVRMFTWSLIFNEKHCNAIRLFFPTLYLLQKTIYYEFLNTRLKITFEKSISEPKKPLFEEKIWCLKAYNYTQYIFFTFCMLVSTDVPPNAKYKSPVWGLWCEEHYSKSFIIPYVSSDAVYSISILYTYIRGLKGLTNLFEHKNNNTDTIENEQTTEEKNYTQITPLKTQRKQSLNERTKSLKASILEMAKTQTILCSIAVVTTIIFIGIANVFLKPLSWLSNIDLLINCLCVYLMFKFVRLTERVKIAGPCFWCWCCWPFKFICWSQDTRYQMEGVKLISRNSHTPSSKQDKSSETSSPKKKLPVTLDVGVNEYIGNKNDDTYTYDSGEVDSATESNKLKGNHVPNDSSFKE